MKNRKIKRGFSLGLAGALAALPLSMCFLEPIDTVESKALGLGTGTSNVAVNEYYWLDFRALMDGQHLIYPDSSGIFDDYTFSYSFLTTSLPKYIPMYYDFIRPNPDTSYYPLVVGENYTLGGDYLTDFRFQYDSTDNSDAYLRFSSQSARYALSLPDDTVVQSLSCFSKYVPVDWVFTAFFDGSGMSYVNSNCLNGFSFDLTLGYILPDNDEYRTVSFSIPLHYFGNSSPSIELEDDGITFYFDCLSSYLDRNTVFNEEYYFNINGIDSFYIESLDLSFYTSSTGLTNYYPDYPPPDSISYFNYAFAIGSNPISVMEFDEYTKKAGLISSTIQVNYAEDPLLSIYRIVDDFFSMEIIPGFSLGIFLIIGIAGLMLGFMLKMFLGG